MATVSIDNIRLMNFDAENPDHIDLYAELTSGRSKSNMIHQINERLINSRDTESLEFDNAYVMYIADNVIGYLYLTGKRAGSCYIEMSLLREWRGKHLGTYLLDAITNYILENNTDLKSIKASIDRSNLTSMKMAENAGFCYDDEGYMNEKIDFVKDNPYYRRKER